MTFVSVHRNSSVSLPPPPGKSPYLMFTNRHEIRRIDLLKSEYTQVVPTLKNAVALDVDVSTNKMFWCDLYHRKIYRYSRCGSELTVWSEACVFDVPVSARRDSDTCSVRECVSVVSPVRFV